jgi:hypothetical protein
VAFRADLEDGIVDNALQLVLVGVCVARYDVLNDVMQAASAYRLLNELSRGRGRERSRNQA